MLESLKLDYPPTHGNSRDANKTLEWLPCDDEYYFKKNMQDPVKRKYIKSMGWETPGCFTYKMNSQGFRTEELERDTESFVALGCSFTCGIGLPLEMVWPSLLASRLNRRVFNLGVGGCGLDTVFRIADYWLPIINPKFVALLVPPMGRIEVLDNFGWNIMHACDIKENFLKHWFLHDENSKINARKNILAIQYICDTLKIPLYTVDSKFLASTDNARDFMHQGPQGHLDLVEMFAGQGIDDVKKP